MKRNFLITTLLIFSLGTEVFPQVKWTIDECIKYAITNNLALQRQKLQTEINQVDLTRSRMQVLPDLNFGTDARVGFGRSVNPVTNLITFKQNLGNSYALSSDINLFNGLATLNLIEANKFMLKAGIEMEKVVTNSLVIDLLGAYYQALYCKGLEDAAKMQLDLSEKQLFRISKTVETGKEALSRKFEIESRVAEDKLAFTIARNNKDKAITALKQIMQLEAGTEFDLAMPDLSLMILETGKVDTDSIYAIASVVLPRLKAINYELKAMTKQVAAARGAILPSLAVGGAIYTGYYAVLSDPLDGQDSYSQQLRNNNSQSVYASLRVPLFNKYTTGRNIRLARIYLNDTRLRLEQEKNALYAAIETSCVNVNSGGDEYQAALSSLEFNKKSFEAVEKKFEAGLVDVTDYSEAKTKLFTAETETVRTKLQLLIRRLSIRLYCTGEYETITL